MRMGRQVFKFRKHRLSIERTANGFQLVINKVSTFLFIFSCLQQVVQ